MKYGLCLAALTLIASGCSQSCEFSGQSAQMNADTTAAPEIAVAETASVTPTKFVAAQAKTATLKVKFVYDGKAPVRKPVKDTKNDPFCAPFTFLEESMIVGEDGGIQNVAMYLTDSDEDLPEVPLPEKKPVLDNKNCIFEPHVIAARVGQTITVKNSDQAGHNANFSAFFNNPGVNFLIPAMQEKDLKLVADEPAPIPVTCNIHPWMKAYLIATEHSFVGVSDKAGELVIEGLPTGKVEFKIWHENSKKSLDEATIDGKKQKWRRGKAEFELKPGMNDLGTVVFSPDLFESE